MHKLGFCTYLISASIFKILVLTIEARLKAEKLVKLLFLTQFLYLYNCCEKN